VKPAPFAYERPPDLGRAVRLLADGAGEARALAGGQSLVPLMNLRLVQPRLVVDLSAVEELKRASEEDGRIVIGAMCTHAAIEDGHARLGEASRLGVAFGGARAGEARAGGTNAMLRLVAGGIGYRGIRNRGTIGGSVAHADPSADWPAALTALGAEAVIEGSRGRRVVPLESLVLGGFTTALESGEILVAFRIPKLSSGARWRYLKLCRKTGEFAHAIAAVVLDPARAFARVVVGAAGGAPILLPALAQRLAAPDGRSFADRFGAGEAAAALKDLAAGLDPVDLRIHAALLGRAIKGAFS